jgi:hypothetical protein
MLISLVCTLQKNVYSVFRADPPSIGFAQLSSVAGGSGERGCSLVFPMTSTLLLPFQALQAAMVPQRQPRAMVPQRRPRAMVPQRQPRALEAAVRFPLVSAYPFLTSCFTADRGSSTKITLPTTMIAAIIAVFMCLL